MFECIYLKNRSCLRKMVTVFGFSQEYIGSILNIHWYMSHFHANRFSCVQASECTKKRKNLIIALNCFFFLFIFTLIIMKIIKASERTFGVFKSEDLHEDEVISSLGIFSKLQVTFLFIMIPRD